MSRQLSIVQYVTIVTPAIVSQLPLSDRVPIAAAVVFRLHLEGKSHGDKDIDRELVDVVDADYGLLRSETNKHELVYCNCN